MNGATAMTICFGLFVLMLCILAYVDLQRGAEDTKRMIACVQSGGEWARPGWLDSQYGCVRANEERDAE